MGGGDAERKRGNSGNPFCRSNGVAYTCARFYSRAAGPAGGDAQILEMAIVVRHTPSVTSPSFVRHDHEGVTDLLRGARDPENYSLTAG